MAEHTVLAAVDLDETAEVVLNVAQAQARAHGGRLVVAHVVPDAALAFPEARIATPEVPAGIPEEPLLLRDAGERLDALVASARAAGVPTEGAVSHGAPAETIVDLADAWDAELVVVGTHGRRGLARVLVGSVAEGILRRSRVPVLVVPTRETNERPEDDRR